MMRLFDTEKGYTYTAEGRAVSNMTAELLKPLIDDILAKGLDIVDAETIMISAISIAFYEIRLTHGREMNERPY